MNKSPNNDRGRGRNWKVGQNENRKRKGGE
jgi:hypothetical protein